MKYKTNLNNKVVLIKSLKKINKIKHKYGMDKCGKYKQYAWNDQYMCDLAGTVVTLGANSMTQSIKGVTWHISPWMVEAIVECPRTTMNFPVYKRHVDIGIVVEFTSETSGRILLSRSKDRLNKKEYNLKSCTDAVWVDLPYNEKRGLYHGQPIICWDDSARYIRSLTFYNAKEDRTFRYTGSSKMGPKYKHYEAIPFKDVPFWMRDLYSTLPLND